ncbi:membrane-associated protein, putative [Bodo saltans]|uniref:Membrane-associated protein, putative n=1 Tax=Bodo saltans TaxID=75058 RepID=A0A0S4KHL9_BODSA|nr:membrane-associated protein, putative [Bodo saltans]|eukprot:CUI11712.1 membrane-associated protein, putative [Bodo saltans]
MKQLLLVLFMFATLATSQNVLRYPTATDSNIPAIINVMYNVSAVHITLNRSVVPLGGLPASVRIVLVDWVLPTSGAGSATRALLINVTRHSNARNILITVDGDSGSTAPTAIAVRSTTTACTAYKSTIRQVMVVISSVDAAPCTYNVSDGSQLPACAGPLLVATRNTVVLRNLALCGATSGAVLTPGWPDAWGVTLANVQLADSASVSVYPARTMRVSSSLDNVHVTLGLPLTVRSGAHVSISALMNATVVIDAASTSTKQLVVDGTGSSVVVSSCGLVSDSTLGYAGFSHNLLSSATSAASVISVTGGAALRIVNNTCLGSRVAGTATRSAQDVCALVLAASTGGIVVDGVGSVLQVSGNVVSATGGKSPASWGTAWFGGLAVVVLSSSTAASVSVTGGSSLLIEGNRVSCAHRGISLVSSVDSVATNGAGCSLIVSGSLVSVSNNTVSVSSVPSAPATPWTPLDVALDLWMTGTAGVLTLSARSSVLLHGNALTFVDNTNNAAMVLRLWVQLGTVFSLQQQSLLSLWNNSATFAPIDVVAPSIAPVVDALVGVVASKAAFTLATDSSVVMERNTFVVTNGQIRIGAIVLLGACTNAALSFIGSVSGSSSKWSVTIGDNVVSCGKGCSFSSSNGGSSLVQAATVSPSLIFVGGVSTAMMMCSLALSVNQTLALINNDVEINSLSTAPQRTELFGVLVVVSQLIVNESVASVGNAVVPVAALTLARNKVVMLSSFASTTSTPAFLVCGIALRGSLSVSDNASMMITGNSVTVSTMQLPIGAVYYVLGIAVLLARLEVRGAPTMSSSGLLILSNSYVQLTGNMIRVTSSRSLMSSDNTVVCGVYLGAEPLLTVNALSIPTTVWVSTNSRLVISVNNVASVSGLNLNAIVGVYVFRETVVQVDTTSTTVLSNNSIAVSGVLTTTAPSDYFTKVMTVHGIQVGNTLTNGDTSMRLLSTSVFEVSLNMIQVAGTATLGNVNSNGVLPLFRAIGICVLVTRDQQATFLSPSTPRLAIRMTFDFSSQLLVVRNTLNAQANFTLLENPSSTAAIGLPMQIVSAVYLGLEHGSIAPTNFVVCALMQNQSRLTFDQNVISITSVNVHVAATVLLKGMRFLVDSASFVGITKNRLTNLSAWTTIPSSISYFPSLAAIGVLVTDGSNLLALFVDAPPYSGSFTSTVLGAGGQHQISNGSLVIVSNNVITFSTIAQQPRAVPGRAAPIVAIGVAWSLGNIGTMMVSSRSLWSVSVNKIFLLSVRNATALGGLIDGGTNELTAMRVVLVAKGAGSGALLVLNASTSEISDNVLTVPRRSDTTLAVATVLLALQLYSANTQIEEGAPATLLVSGISSAVALSRNVIAVSSGDPVESCLNPIVATSGILLYVTNAAGIAVAVFGAASFAIDGNDAAGDGSRGSTAISRGCASYFLGLSNSFLTIAISSVFSIATPASLLDPYVSALIEPAMLQSTVVYGGGGTFSVQNNVALAVTQQFLSISLTNSANQGAVLCLRDSSSFLVEGNEVDRVMSGDAIVLSLSFLTIANSVSTAGLSFYVIGSSVVSVRRNYVRNAGSASNLQRGIVITSIGRLWSYSQTNCYNVPDPPSLLGGTRKAMTLEGDPPPLPPPPPPPPPPPTMCETSYYYYALLPLNVLSHSSRFTLGSNVISAIDAAVWISLGSSMLLNLSSVVAVQLNVLQSSRGTAVLSIGSDTSLGNPYNLVCVVTCTQGALVLVERNTLVSRSTASVGCIVFPGSWRFESNTSTMLVRRNECLFTNAQSAKSRLLSFDAFTSVSTELTFTMGPCDTVNKKMLTSRAAYVSAGAPSGRVVNCTSFSASESFRSVVTDSEVPSRSTSSQQSKTTSHTLVPAPHVRTSTVLGTQSRGNPSRSVVTLTPSLSRSMNASMSTALSATTTPSQSKMSLSLGASQELDHAVRRGRVVTLSLTDSPTDSTSTTASFMPLGTSSPTISFSGSCVPSDDIAAVAPLFPMFQLLTDIRESEDFTPVLPSGGVLPGVWASPLDSLVFSRVVGTPPIAAPTDGEAKILPVILCRRPVSYPTPTVVPAASLTSVFGNGTVVIANSSMSLFTVHQWMSADQTFLSGDILEVRFLVEDWFNAAMDRRSARFNALPCRPQDSVVLAYVQLGGVLSAAQTAVQTTVGAVSTFTMIVSLLVGDGGNELQTMVLASMMECTPRGGSVQNSLGNLRSLAPLLLEESYLGVILGNLLLIGCVLGVQCVVMAVLALSRCAKNQPLRFGWATSGNEPSTNDAEVQSMEYSNDENTMAENHSRLLLQDDDEERAGLQAEDLLLPELPIPAPLTDPAATVLWEEENVASTAIGVAIDDSTQTKQKKDVSGRDDDVCDTSPEMQKRNGFPLADPPMSILSSVLFPGALFSVVAFTFQGTLFSGIRLVQLYRPGGTAVDSDSTRVAIGIVTMIILLPLPFGLVYFMHDRMHRSYHRYLVPLRRSGDRLSCLHRLFSVVPGAECGGVMLPRGVERVWGPFVSNCRPNRVWCVLPFASGWLMCVATVAQFFTSPIFCTAILVIVGVSNVALSCFIVWLRPRLSPLLNVLFVVQLCNNTAALIVNAVSIHLPVSSTVTIVIGLLQSALSVATTFATVASALTNIFQERREGLLGLEWHIGPLCSEAQAVNAATDSVE